MGTMSLLCFLVVMSSLNHVSKPSALDDQLFLTFHLVTFVHAYVHAHFAQVSCVHPVLFIHTVMLTQHVHTVYILI